jgi:hypothetical protein
MQGRIVGRTDAEIAEVLERVTAAGRAEYWQWGRWSPEDNEKSRRFGISTTGHWLINPKETIGPLSDGPAASAERVRREAELARRLIPNGVSRNPRYAPSSGPGFRQRWEAEVLGIAQMLEYALGLADEVPGFGPQPAPVTHPAPANRSSAVLRQPPEQFVAALTIARAVYDAEPAATTVKMYVGGVVAAGQWLLKLTNATPVSGEPATPTGRRAESEMIAASETSLGLPGARPGIPRAWADGAYRMIMYALAVTDEMPVEMTRRAADMLLARRDAA